MDFKMCSLDSKGTWNWEEFKFFHDKMISEARKPDKSAGGHTSYKAREGEIRRCAPGAARVVSCRRVLLCAVRVVSCRVRLG